MELIYFTKFLKGLSAKEVGQTAKRLGFDGLDLAIRDGQCVNPDNVATALPEAMRIWKDMGISVPLVSMETRQTDPHAESTRRIYEACAKAGIPNIKVGYWRWDADLPYWPGIASVRSDLRVLQALSGKLGVRTVLHTHSGTYFGCNASAAMQLVQGLNPRFVGLYLDFAHLAINGEPLPLALAIARDYLTLVAAKNCRYVKADSNSPVAVWEKDWCLLNEGLVNWPDAIDRLRKTGYDAPISLHGEYSGPEDREAILERVEKDAAFMRKTAKAG